MVSQEEKRTYCDYESYIDFHGYNLWDEIMSIPRQAYGQVVPLQEDVLARPGFRTIPLANTFSCLLYTSPSGSITSFLMSLTRLFNTGRGK